MPTATMLLSMTPFPYSIDADRTAADANRLMQQHDLRHLPVTRDGDIYGVLSERDLRSLFADPEANPEQTPIHTLCPVDPFIVETTTPLAEALEVMAERRIGCAVVVEEERVAGIYTTVDACRQLAELLRAAEEE